MPLGQVILNTEYCPGDCSQTVTGHPAVSQVVLSRTSVIFRIGLRRQFNVGSSREPAGEVDRSRVWEVTGRWGPVSCSRVVLRKWIRDRV